MQSVLFLNRKTLQNIKRFHWLNRRTEENEVFSHYLYNPCCHLKNGKKKALDNIWNLFIVHKQTVMHNKALSENSALLFSSTTWKDKETASLKSHPIQCASQKIPIVVYAFCCLDVHLKLLGVALLKFIFSVWIFGNCYFKVLNMLSQHEKIFWLNMDIIPYSTDCLHTHQCANRCTHAKLMDRIFFPQQETIQILKTTVQMISIYSKTGFSFPKQERHVESFILVYQLLDQIHIWKTRELKLMFFCMF